MPVVLPQQTALPIASSVAQSTAGATPACGPAAYVVVLLAALLGGAQVAVGGVDISQLKSIVLAPDADRHEEQAARELARYLERIFSVKLAVEVRQEIGPATTGVILLGKRAAIAAGAITAEELAAVRCDGYVIRAKDGRIALAGDRGLATLFAVAGLLEHLGAEFYGATEVVPKRDDKTIADFTVSEKPAFEFRAASTSDWRLKSSRAGDLANAGPVAGKELWPNTWSWHEHTAGYLVPKTLYYDAHPEYFAMLEDGKRIAKDSFDIWRTPLCLSNPDVTRISVERMRAWVKSQPDCRFFSLTYGDTLTHCQCPECRKLDPVPGQHADRLLHWVNAVADALGKEFPDKVFITFAYVNTDAAPKRLKPAPNVLVLYAPWYGRCTNCRVHPYHTCWQSIVAAEQMEDWLKWCPHNLGVYDYGFGLAQLRAFEDKIKFWAKRRYRGFYQCGWGTSLRALQNYVIPKLLWNPKLDARELERKFCEAYYGPAGKHVADYIDLWYHEWVETGSHQIRGQKDYPARAKALLADARKAVAGTEWEKRLDEPQGLPAWDASNVNAQASYKPTGEGENWGQDAVPIEPEAGFQGYDRAHLWLSEPRLGRKDFANDFTLTRIDAICAPGMAEAGRKLQAHIKAIYGIEVPLKEVALSKEPRGIIAVGRQAALASGLVEEADFTLAGPQGIVVRARGGRAAIAATRDDNIQAAIDSFLFIIRSRHGGRRSGVELPRSPVPVMRCFTLVDWPPLEAAAAKD